MSELFTSVIDFVFPKEKVVSALENLSTDEFRNSLPRSSSNSSLFNSQYPEVKALEKEITERKNKKLSFMCAEVLSENILDKIWEYQTFNPKTKFVLVSDQNYRVVGNYIKKMVPHISYYPETLKIIDPSKVRGSIVFVLENYRDNNVTPIVSKYNPKEILPISITG